MWFERLVEGAKENNSPEAIKALYQIMFYYFIAVSFIGLIWLLWQVVELRSAIVYNLCLLVGVFGVMLLGEEGLRRAKSWAKMLLILNYVCITGGAVWGVGLAINTLFKEITPGEVIAAFIYMLIALLSGYGIYTLFSHAARKIKWC
jgi:hypothetical protein